MKKKFKGMLKNKMFVIGMILFGSMLLVAIFAPLIAPHTYDEQNMAMKLTAPCAEYPLVRISTADVFSAEWYTVPGSLSA